MAKEAKKTKPITIRFNIEKLEFLITQRKCNSIQDNVDYLLDRFWWEMGGDVLSANYIQNNVPVSNNLPTHSSVKKQYVEPHQQKEVPQLSVYEIYKAEFSNALCADDIAITLREMKKEKLLPKEKIELEAYATKVFNEKGFYHD